MNDLAEAIREYMEQENIRTLEIYLASKGGKTFTVRANHNNQNGFIPGTIGEAYSYEEAWRRFETDLAFVPKEER
jgi:hypothetical protein